MVPFWSNRKSFTVTLPRLSTRQCISDSKFAGGLLHSAQNPSIALQDDAAALPANTIITLLSSSRAIKWSLNGNNSEKHSRQASLFPFPTADEERHENYL